MRYFLEIAYKGTHYSGWQVQPNGVSVQQKIDEALQTILRQDIHCIGCGRTDAGVHAEQFYLHFETDKTVEGDELEIPGNFVLRMNTFLPADIAVKRIIPVHEKAHARFDATMRAYEYRISFEKNVFRNGLLYHRHFRDLDMEIMKEACEIIKKYDDFPSFCKSKQGSKTTIVHIKELYWKEENGLWILYISADRFLRGMVRLIVGVMIQLGKHRMSLEDLEKGLTNKERFKFALSAPAEGLYLTKVRYSYIND